VLVVFDTNVFYGDVRADRSRLRSILDGAVAVGSFSLFIPEVVLQELDKQFLRRTKKALREINDAIGKQEDELKELGVPAPPRLDRDEADIAGYRGALEARLRQAGAKLLPIPNDLSPALSWAIARRKPFNAQGTGLPDAVLWLSVLELAKGTDEEIVLVAKDNNFAEGKPPQLAKVLRDDLKAQGCRGDQVRLVFGIDAFAKEVSKGQDSAVRAAERLAAEGAFDEAIERALMHGSLPQAPLELGVDLDSDPQVMGWDLESFEIATAAELPGNQVWIEGTATGSALLNLLIYRGDYYAAVESDDAHFSISNPNFNEHYLEGESEVEIEVEMTIAVDPEGSDPEVEVVEVSLSPAEQLGRALHGRELDALLSNVRDLVLERAVAGYLADEPIESEIEEAIVNSAYRQGASVTLLEVTDSEGETHSGRLLARLEADVTWFVSAPTPFDAEHFAALAEGEETGAPFLQGHDSGVSLDVEFLADWDVEHGWHNLELEELTLAEKEAERRRERGTAADHAEEGDLEL
jgi:predicted nucleic acid-binding protein